MKTTDKFRYCKIETEQVEISLGTDRYQEIGIDLRSEPVDSQMDRVCCQCGESLSVDGRCDQCESRRYR